LFLDSLHLSNQLAWDAPGTASNIAAADGLAGTLDIDYNSIKTFKPKLQISVHSVLLHNFDCLAASACRYCDIKGKLTLHFVDQ